MRSVPTVAIAYGCFLGNSDGWAVKEASRHGALNLDWFCDVGDRVSCNQFITAAVSHLSFHNASEGLSFITFGDLVHAGSSDVYVALIARDSYQSTANWGDELIATPEGLTPPERPLWDARLAKALAVLGLTPHQDSPQWRIQPSLS